MREGKFRTQSKFNLLTADSKTCTQVSITTFFSRTDQEENSDITRDVNSDIKQDENPDTSRVLVSNKGSSEGAAKKKTGIIPSDGDLSDALSYLFEIATK